MDKKERIVLGIIVIFTYIVVPIDSTAVETYEKIITSQLDGHDVCGSHVDICCDLVEVGFILRFIGCSIKYPIVKV